MSDEFEALYSKTYLELLEYKKHITPLFMESAQHKAKTWYTCRLDSREFVFLSGKISICAETLHTLIKCLKHTFKGYKMSIYNKTINIFKNMLL